MIRINVSGDCEVLLGNLDFLAELGFENTADGAPLVFRRTEHGELRIERDEKSLIEYSNSAHVIRALLEWSKLTVGETKHIPVNFERIGPMLDVSRDAVMTPDALRNFLRRQARLGLDTCMLYMEDVYEVPEYPYFGYMRGRYSISELQALDNYAAGLGIELIPAIQTLAHLLLPLKWGFAKNIKDTDNILLVDEEETYKFIDHLLASIAKSFHGRKIHIGMDEAWTLGSGNYLRRNGYHTQFEIMTRHLRRVLALTDKYNFKPMIWSDMFFRANSDTADYYDEKVEFTQEMVDQVPDVELTYWDYYHHDTKDYERLLVQHQKLSDRISFAGGVWTWNGLAPNYGKTLATTVAGLEACKKYRITDIYATLWGDDGQETSIDTAWYGLALFAHYQFSDNPTLEGAAKDLSDLLGENAGDYIILSQFDEIPNITPGNPGAASPSKALLYQDLMMPMFDENFRGIDLVTHYGQLAEKLRKTDNVSLMYQFYIRLADFLTKKIPLSGEIRRAYEAHDTVAMARQIGKIQELIEMITDLKVSHWQLWRKNYRSFGWEVLDIRYGALRSRYETTISVLDEWIATLSRTIDTLDEKLLPYDNGMAFGDDVVANAYFGKIITPSELSGV
ncbi:beta-N-acetylhexosaminidase [Lacticaseibacillus daqingensis]|uniref:beta-N-acetylhexosaminidase n=1 Tax=Lacticaseibacillus daqingensis TaxID=2486014 RepID=UPI000F783A7D|nr:beta-N-acetylhexosaminidase [Lacticaseibacillus daqingensis]